jgi:hypothetical protein
LERGIHHHLRMKRREKLSSTSMRVLPVSSDLRLQATGSATSQQHQASQVSTQQATVLP